MSYVLMTFESTHHAIKTEKALEALEIEMIPTPRQLSTSCGLSLKASVKDLEVIRDILGNNIQNYKCYIVDNIDKVLTFKKV